MLKKCLPLLLLVASCKYPPLSSLYDLSSTSEDLAGLYGLYDLRGGPDLTGPTPDLVTPSNCRGSAAPGIRYQLATSRLLTPKSTGANSYAMDLDGDGRPENQFKNIINVLSLSGLDVQMAFDAASAAGVENALVSFTTFDTMNSSCVGVQANWAQPYDKVMPPPKFDGTDVFTPLTPMFAQLSGQLAGGVLGTTLPPMQNAATEQTLTVLLPLGGSTVPLPLRGVHIQGTVIKNGALWEIQNGAIHGAISQIDIDTMLIPVVANMLTNLIHSDTVMGVPGDTAKAVIGLFEQKTGAASRAKCAANIADCCGPAAPMGMMGHPDTCKILPQEVKDSSIGGVVASDVQVLDDFGRWSPTPGGKAYNAMSFGMGFTAVLASY